MKHVRSCDPNSVNIRRVDGVLPVLNRSLKAEVIDSAVTSGSLSVSADN
jgi:hypothetical protein